MAGRGPAPKERHVRERDDAEFATLTSTGVLYGDPLPEGVLPDGESWHRQTVALWDSLRQSPLLANEPALGWQFLVDTALMHHTMWSKGRWEFAAEVRLRVAKFGATPEDRMRLKLKIDGPSPTPTEPTAAVTEITSRRKRLTA
jgi:hypothetical protein